LQALTLFNHRAVEAQFGYHPDQIGGDAVRELTNIGDLARCGVQSRLVARLPLSFGFALLMGFHKKHHYTKDIAGHKEAAEQDESLNKSSQKARVIR
jgi:hypothetical protein